MRRPSEIFQQRIWPAYEDYLAHLGDQRLANVLAGELNAQLEWTFKYYKATDLSRLCGASGLQQFRGIIYGLCPDLSMMKDLADAYKHRTLRPDARRRLFSSTLALYEKREGGLWVNGYEKPFEPAATTAVEFWKTWSD
jgi:hypothetical protein